MKIFRRIIIHLKWYLDKIHFFDNWDDEKYLKFNYYIRIGKRLHLNPPITFNEKIQWLKLYDRNDEYIKMVDKYEAKEYIKKIIGEEYIIPTLGIYDKWDDINFDSLPNQFVLKCTHDSGGIVIVKDKNKFNEKEAKTKIERRLKKNYFYLGREWPYKYIKPRIIVEKYMEDTKDNDLKDYKLMCFNGKVKCSFVCSNRNSSGLCVNFYDINWKPMPFERHYKRNEKETDKPINYDKMIELAEKISSNIRFLRVDFYEINQKIYFGELTFYPGSGVEEFTPEEWDYKLGEWIRL